MKNLKSIWFIQIIILLVINIAVLITGLIFLIVDTPLGIKLEIASLCLTLLITIEALTYFRDVYEEEDKDD